MGKKLGVNEISMTKILPAVKDLNEVVIIDPPIPTKIGVKKEDILNELKEFFKEGPIEQKHYDKLKKQSIETLEVLGFDLLDKGGKEKEDLKEDATETSETEIGKKGKGKTTPAPKKVEAKKPAVKKAPAEKKEGKETIASFVREGLKNKSFEGKTNQQIADICQKRFKSNTTASNIGWYKWKMGK
jgi:hypothetical protein